MARRARVLLSLLLLVFGLPLDSFPQHRGGGHHGSGKKSHPAPRTKHDRTKRSAKAKDDFMRSSGYPHGRPGYVVDHIVPLACGGADSPSNMQWQTKAEAKAKDRVERKGCK